MKIERLFSATGPADFPPRLNDAQVSFLAQLQEKLDDLLDDKEDKIARNLVQAMKLERTLVTACILDIIEDSDNIELYEWFQSSSFYGAWLLDGGDLSALPLFHFQIAASDMLGQGAHFFMLSTGFSDWHKSLRATELYLEGLFDSLKTETSRSHTKVSPIVRLSLHGFSGQPRFPASLASNPQFALYTHQYFSQPGLTLPLKPLSPKLLADVLKSWVIDTQFDLAQDDLDSLLKYLVYNPGLRLKSQGRSCLEITDHLDQLLDQFVHLVSPCIAPEERATMGPIFKRQVLINLFSPFAEDLATLDAQPYELMGRPDLDATRVPGLLAKTFYGPYACFDGSAEGRIVTLRTFALQQVGLPVNIDEILKGTLAVTGQGMEKPLSDLIFTDFGRSNSTDQALDFVLSCEKGDLFDSEAFHLVARRFYDLDFNKHDEAGRLALLAWTVSNTTLEINGVRPGLRGFILSSFDGTTPRERLQAEPTLKPKLVKFLDRHELLDADVLRWCGFASTDLLTIKSSLPETVKESLICQDLGL